MPHSPDISEEVCTASHSRDDFLALLGHELRTPLNSIMGMLQLALHARSRDNIQEYLTVALESSKHMLYLLGDISEIASSDTAARQITPEYFDLESLVSPTIASLATSAGSKGHAISCRIDPKLPKRLWGDPGRIRQIIFNLLANAVKYTPRGEIDVEISSFAEYDSLKRYGLHILIRASYADITKQASSGQTQHGASHGDACSGLGISIAKQLVHALGGELAVFSQDKCNEVRVLLPLQVRQETQRAPDEQSGAEIPLQADAAKILVVEDEPINLKTMLLSLELLGCKGVGADSAYKGLALLRKEKFDVVLMDIQMPGLDGLEATRLIRGDTSGSLDAGIPIVAITAHALHGDKERILKAGVDAYLAKPVYLEQLRDVLSKILQRPLELNIM
jgi:CheY-like chemotaxis protein